MANALGFPDGQYLPWADMLDAVARVCRAVKVPVTADIESGFAPDVTALETSIRQIIDAGAVGVNLEDVMPANPAFEDNGLQSADLQNADAKNTGSKKAVSENRGSENADLQNAVPEKRGPANTGPQNADHKTAAAKNAAAKNAVPVRHGGPLFPLPVQIARIQAARRAAKAAGIHLVINARTDAYWQAGVSPAEAMRNTLERGKAYLHAGADCIFIPGLRNPDHIKTVIDHLRTGYVRPDHLRADDLRADQPHAGQSHAAQSHGDDRSANNQIPPINILAGPGVPSIPELAKLGVKRVSYGSGPHRAAMGLLRRMAEEAKTSGTFQALTEGAVPYEEINGLFPR
jgi:2-methylisocitrate lyase-like PEP mutase family enzyme